MRFPAGVFGLLLAATVAASAEMRTWTFEKSGKTVRGEVVGFEGDSVTLKLDDGKTFSVPTSYFIQSDRAKLASEQAHQWKEAEVVRLVSSLSSYKKCTVKFLDKRDGGETEVLIKLLPPSVEAVLNERDRMVARAAELHKSERWVRVEGIDGSVTEQGYNVSQEHVRLEKALREYGYKTKQSRVVVIKRTGLSYQGLPVWECKKGPYQLSSKAAPTVNERTGKKKSQ